MKQPNSSVSISIVFIFIFSVDIMSKKLDPEGLGIILLNAFMDEFFPDEKRSTPDTFDLLHYNGIPRSNVDDKVRKLSLITMNCS